MRAMVYESTDGMQLQTGHSYGVCESIGGVRSYRQVTPTELRKQRRHVNYRQVTPTELCTHRTACVATDRSLLRSCENRGATSTTDRLLLRSYESIGRGA